MESMSSSGSLPPEACWVALSALTDTSFHDPVQYRQVISALQNIDAACVRRHPAPFQRLGWLAELSLWIEQQIAPLGIRLTGRFRQLTASPSFSLVRFETTGPAVWFKAVGQPNVREFHIILSLTQLFPAFLPVVIASRPEWNAWLAIEARGTSPDALSEFAVWKSITVNLAQLQVASVGEFKRLLDTGLCNIGPEALLSRVDEFFAVMAELMRQQIIDSPRRLTVGEIYVLKDQVRETLTTLANRRLPVALNHLDFNPGNILVDDHHCTFVDWAEAAIGHPFFTFEYLLEHFNRLYPQSLSHQAELTAEYARVWGRYAPQVDISHSLSLAPLAAVFAYATSSGIWHQAAHLSTPQTAGYLRSLTRRMKREADALASRSLECLSR